MGEKTDFKLTGLRVVWVGDVTVQMEILKLKEGNTNQMSIQGMFKCMSIRKYILGLLSDVIFFAEILLHNVIEATLGKRLL